MDGVRGPWLFPGGTFQGQVCRHLGLEKSCGAWRVVEEAVSEQWERRDGCSGGFVRENSSLNATLEVHPRAGRAQSWGAFPERQAVGRATFGCFGFAAFSRWSA